MRNCRSLKRRRSWLEIGFAGCVMLSNPTQGGAAAAWPSLGTVWSAPQRQHTPTQQQRPSVKPLQQTQQSSHHGTQATPAAAAAAAPPPLPPTSVRGKGTTARRHSSSTREHRPAEDSDDHSKLLRRALLLPGGVHEVEIVLHAGVGDWGACSPETCTQTRQVFCETRESRIVASGLCGDQLPEAERVCEGEDVAAVCGDAAAAAAAAAKGGASVAVGVEGRGGAAGGGGSGPRPATLPSTGNTSATSRVKSAAAAAAAASPSSATAGELSSNNNSGNGNGSSRDQRSGAEPAAGDNRENNRASPPRKVPAPESPWKRATAPEAPAAPAEERDVAEAQDEGGSSEEGGSGADSIKPAPSRQQGETPGNPSASAAGSTPKSTPTKPNLASSGGRLNQMGGAGHRSHRLEYRFWLVLAIGAGAVGSFMAVVVFSVGQYQKEQHRLRGIMALNEFPQDNYINPFAQQLSSSDLPEDDRSAFTRL